MPAIYGNLVKYAENEMYKWVDSLGKAAFGLTEGIGKDLSSYPDGYDYLNRNDGVKSHGMHTDDDE